MNVVYRPELLRLGLEQDRERYEALLSRGTKVVDSIEDQVFELMLCRNASMKKEEVRNAKLAEKYLEDQGVKTEEFGTWVYYSWKDLLVHVLPEEEYIEVRTNRNREKLQTEDQQKLRSKRIGIAGLSVGRSIAVTLATERLAGEFYLADFDTIELSNLNRIKAPLTELGDNKAIACAREIAEMDPYLQVRCFTDGLHKDNLNEFMQGDRQLDLFIEECDDMYIKVHSRIKCRELGIPVLMETNDRCQVDIERFDIERERPIFHGKLEEVDLSVLDRELTQEEKIAFLSRLIDIPNISEGMRRSLPQMGKTIRSWPQLASDVTLGAGVLALLTNGLFTGNEIESGTYYYGINER